MREVGLIGHVEESRLYVWPGEGQRDWAAQARSARSLPCLTWTAPNSSCALCEVVAKARTEPGLAELA